MSDPNYSECPPASLLRQLAAMIYDSLLVLALLFLAVGTVVAFNGGEAVEPNIAFKLYLLCVVFTFYAWFWHKSGQTLGMRAWRIRIVDANGVNPGWGTCYLRLCCALLSWSCFGLGYLWRLFKPWTWHDRLSDTRIIDLSPLHKARKGAKSLATDAPAEDQEKSEAEK
jgi:uncharacterized RDD family membrane protein YckC